MGQLQTCLVYRGKKYSFPKPLLSTLVEAETKRISVILSSTMVSRIAARYFSRRLSSSGKILGEEEKAAENIYIKKTEQEKLEKLARKGPKPEEKSAAGSDASVTDSKPSSSTSSPGASTEKVSTDKYRNYAVVAGTITAISALGWYLKSKKKAEEDVQD